MANWWLIYISFVHLSAYISQAVRFRGRFRFSKDQNHKSQHHTKLAPCSLLIFSWDRVVKKVVQFCLIKFFCFWKLVVVLKCCIYVQGKEYIQIFRFSSWFLFNVLFNAYKTQYSLSLSQVFFFKLEVKVFGLKCYEVISGFVSMHF